MLTMLLEFCNEIVYFNKDVVCCLLKTCLFDLKSLTTALFALMFTCLISAS